MLSDDEWRRMEQMIAALLDARGLKTLPTAAAVRMQRYRAKRNESVTPSVTKRNGEDHESVTPKRKRRNKGVTGDVTVRVTQEAPTNATWRAYSTAYEQRWGAAPTRNRTMNGMLAQFVSRIPAEEAPAVAAFYVRSNRGLYVSAKHPVNLLLRNAESLRTEWATGRSGTETEARQADQTQARGNVWGKLIEEADQRENNGAK